MKPLITAIYMRKLAIFERKLLDPVTGAVVLWEMFESCLYPWSGLWWLHKCLQACCYLAECRIYSSWFKRSWPLISEVLTGLFSLLHKENSFKYLFYLFYFFFPPAQDAPPLKCSMVGGFFNTMGCSDNIFQAQNVFVAGHCGDAHKGSSLSVTPDVMVVWNLPTSKSFHVFQCHSNLQHLPTALKSMEESLLLMSQRE